MFSKACFLLLLMISLSCFGQVTIIGGTATNIGPSAAISPLISTPDIALPGSGSPVGAPLASAAANDSRFSRGPMIYNPNGGEYVTPATNGSGVGAVPRAEPHNAAAAEQFEFGIQHFESGSLNVGASPISLGQIARNYRSQPHLASRTYSNDTIAQMKTEAVSMGNLGTGSTAQSSTTPIATVVAENRAPALPQNDREIAANTQSMAERRPTVSQHPQRTSNQDAPASVSDTAASAPPTTVAQTSLEPSRLPQTGSFLFLVALVGGAALVAGVLYCLRR